MSTFNDIRISQMRSAKKQEDAYHGYAVRNNVSDSFLFLMYVFHEDGDGLTQAEIGQILNLPKQTVNSSLKKMEKEGIIRFLADGSDKKKKRVYLTQTGREQMTALIEPLVEAENRAYESLGKEAASLLADLCRRETEALSAQIKKVIQ